MELTTIFKYSTGIVPIILVIACAMGIYKYKQLNAISKLLLLLLGLSLLCDIASRILAIVYKNNLIITIIYPFVNLACLYWIYQKYFFDKPKKVITWLLGLSSIFWLYDLWNFEMKNYKEFSPYSITLINCTIIILCIQYLFYLIENEKTRNKKVIKFNSINLFFFAYNLIFLLTINLHVNLPDQSILFIWGTNTFINALYYSYLGTQVWKNGMILKH